MNQERIVNILLNYESSICLRSSTDNVLHLSHILYDLDALSAIRILARFDYPSVFRCSVFASDGLNFLLFIRFVFTLILRQILLLFLFVILFDGFLGHLVTSLDLVLQVVVVTDKLAVFWIMDTFGRMECQRQHFKWILTNYFVVLSHINKDSLLICQLLVVLHPVVEFERHNNLCRLILLQLFRAIHWCWDRVSWHTNRIPLA